MLDCVPCTSYIYNIYNICISICPAGICLLIFLYLCVCVSVGDHERRLHLTVSKGCDRFCDTVVLVQSGKLIVT